MIIILNNSLQRLGVIKYAIDSTRLEAINGENTLDFTAILDTKLSSLIDENSIFELNEDYFDTAKFNKLVNDDNTYTIQVESEHISYRLNNPDYNCETFTQTGTPSFILGKILEGTGFTVGTVESTTQSTYSAQEAKSRRQILMEFVALINGELDFNKMEVSILNHRGSTAAKLVIKDRNVRVMSKSVNKRDTNAWGEPIVSYSCEPLTLPDSDYVLGDDVILINKPLNIKEQLRVIKITSNPYDASDQKFEFSNYTNGLADSIFRIATQSVVKDKLYNGVKIGPEFGFEAIRNDKKARAYFRSDGMKFQSGDGTGENWKDRLYYAYDSEKDETALVFDGAFSADSIEAIKANIDIVISNTTITKTLYAQKGVIAELTVDELNTSNKIERYFNHNTSPIKYIKISNQHIEGEDKSVIEFITGVTDGTVEQLKDRHGLPVFWADEEFTGITMTVTEWPVMQYHYVETVTSMLDEDPIVTDVNIMDDNISITYSDGSVHGYPIVKDEDGHVTNIGDINIGYGGSVTAPNFVSATTTADGTEIIITFDKAIADPTGKQAEFTVTSASSSPTLVSATTSTDGSKVILTFDKAMADVVGKQSEFRINAIDEVMASDLLISWSNLDEADNNKIILWLEVDTSISNNQTIKTSYTKGTVKDTDGIDLASYADQAVTNAVPSPYQKWSGLPDSPILTNDFPNQCVCQSGGYLYLNVSTGKFYADGINFKSLSISKIYQKSGSTWTYIMEAPANSELFAKNGISQANADVYTDSTLSTVYFAKTT